MSGTAKRTRKARKGSEVTPAEQTDLLVQKTEGGIQFRLASEVQMRQVQWFFHPWIPRAMLTLVVGPPAVGKSSFLAALMAHATGGNALEPRTAMRAGRVVLLPGAEEDVDVMTIPRLKRAGADLSKVKLLEGSNLALIRDHDRLVKIVQQFEASLVVGDPIDSYADEGLQEDKGQHVRPLLEAAASLAQKTGAAVVFARHPGKDMSNVLPGSRQWRAVPRSVLLLSEDGGRPPTYVLSHYKDSLGTDSVPRRYSLMDDGSGPRLFRLEEEVDTSQEELAKANGGPTGRWKLFAACRLIRWLFEEEESPTRAQLGEDARKLGLGEDTVNDALRLLGVKSIPPTERGLPWRLVRTMEDWPAWLPDVRGGAGGPEMSGDV